MFDPKTTTSEYMSLVVTHACTRKCPFCIDKYRGNDEYMSLETVGKAIEYGLKNSIKDALIVGGEPTLHPQIAEIVIMLKVAGFRVILTTNYDNPEVIARLDGLVDCFNISYYNQKDLPSQCDMASDLTIHALIHARQLNTQEKLDKFIDDHQDKGHLKFSTLTVCNDWTERNRQVDYLDQLECDWIVLFNEIMGQEYRGTIIKRYDRVVNHTAMQSTKVHVDGEISTSWNRKGK